MNRVINDMRAFFFILILLFPLFPVYFDSSHIHINLLLVVYFLVSVLVPFLVGWGVRKPNVYVLMYYLLLQFLLVPSYLKDIQSGVEGFSGVFSFFRPLLLLGIYFSLNELSLRFLKGSSKFLIFFMVASICYSLVEIFSLWDWFVYFFYKREDKTVLNNVVITFFGTTYYAGYAYLICFLLSYSLYKVKGGKLYLLMVFFSFILVLFAQSKIMWFALVVISLGMYYFNYSSTYLGKLSRIFCLSCLLLLPLFFIDGIYNFIQEARLTSIKSLKTLLFDMENSGTLLVRLEQIKSTIDSLLEEQSIFGAGLGRNVDLESWVSAFLFRYGVLGVLLFLVFNIYLIYLSWVSMNRMRHTPYFFYAVACFLWAITLPLTQLSSVMMETSKLALLSVFMIALTTNLYSLRTVNESN